MRIENGKIVETDGKTYAENVAAVNRTFSQRDITVTDRYARSDKNTGRLLDLLVFHGDGRKGFPGGMPEPVHDALERVLGGWLAYDEIDIKLTVLADQGKNESDKEFASLLSELEMVSNSLRGID